MKIKLIRKLQLDKRNMTWFYEEYIEKQCKIKLSTFMNQLSDNKKYKMREDVEKVILEFIEPTQNIDPTGEIGEKLRNRIAESNKRLGEIIEEEEKEAAKSIEKLIDGMHG